jgi:hypothetical protein
MFSKAAPQQNYRRVHRKAARWRLSTGIVWGDPFDISVCR